MKIKIAQFSFNDEGYPDHQKMVAEFISDNIVEVSNLTPEVKHIATKQREVSVEVADAMCNGYVLREKENSIVVKLY